MTISFEIPESVERLLSEGGKSASQTVKEAALVELYREGKLFHSQLAKLLGLSRYELDGLLKAKGIHLDMSPDDLDAEVSAMHSVLERG